MSWQSPVLHWSQCDTQRQAALRTAWSTGNLEYKLHPEQRIVAAETVASWKNVTSSLDRVATWDISRQFGKDFGMSTLGIGACLRRRKPTRIVYAAPTREMLKELIVPTMVDVFKDCPPDLLPMEMAKGTFERTADTLTWPWGARIVLAGVDLHPDRLRGPATYGFLFTECAFVGNLIELMDGVILPQLLTVNDGWVIMASTPPVVPAHPWTTKYIPEAKERKMYWKRVITDNARLDKSQVDAAIRVLGGKESTRVRRELFCEHIVDTASVVIPEFLPEENIIDDDRTPPPFRDCYVSLDPGMIHASGALGGYYDFEKDRLIIEWDYAKSGLNSRAVARAIYAREWQFWGKEPRRKDSLTEKAWQDELALIRAEFLPERPSVTTPVLSQRNGRLEQAPYQRFSDTDARLIQDLSTEHGLVFTPALKDDLEAAVNSLRLRIQERRILFKRSCVQAINHVQNAVWNKQRTKFAEEPGGKGHYDCLAAAIYMNRQVPWGRNPNPPIVPDRRTHWVGNAKPVESATARAVKAIFGRRR